MKFLNNELINFWLHESTIRFVRIQKNEIHLIFNKGFWDFNHRQKKNCTIVLTIKELNVENVNSFVTITKGGIRKKKQFTLLNFNKAMLKSEFTIDVDYYSEFEKSIMLLGRIRNTEICFKVTDIDHITYLYDS